jgi:1-acyl-sn-glycerol-3-phosphate acyltransferase
MEVARDAPVKAESYSLAIQGPYRIIRGIIRFLLRVLCRFEVVGLEHVPDEGPYLLVTNHIHWLDPPVIMAAFPHRSYVFAAEKWETQWFLGPLFRSVDAIFIQRGEVDRKALRKALSILRGGGVLGLAPEGTRSRSGGMQQGRSGAAYIAYRADVRLVPVVTSGQEQLFPSLGRLRRARVRVAFGPPFDPPAVPSGGKANAAQVHAFGDEIMYRMAAMLPEEYRGLYADVEEKRPDYYKLYAA